MPSEFKSILMVISHVTRNVFANIANIEEKGGLCEVSGRLRPPEGWAGWGGGTRPPSLTYKNICM